MNTTCRKAHVPQDAQLVRPVALRSSLDQVHCPLYYVNNTVVESLESTFPINKLLATVLRSNIADSLSTIFVM